MRLVRLLPPSVIGVLLAAKLRSDLARKRKAVDDLVARARTAPATFDRWAYRVVSQNGEDGIIAVLLDKIGGGKGKFVEFGFGYRQNNMMFNAMRLGMSGLFIDGSPRHCKNLGVALKLLGRTDITIRQEWIDKTNIDRIIVESVGAGDIDVLSTDIDGIDYWVLEAITSVKPKLLIVEFNASFGPARAVTVPYEREFDRTTKHPSMLYWGASLAAFTKLADARGLALIGCDPEGVNAFYVRRDLLQNGLVERSVAEAYRDSSHLTSRFGTDRTEREKTAFSLPVVEV
ncbi:MAG TPA: hypothetical protein VG387_20255 [Rhizomicrobium sp.]|jgi:hypothetical protein|nr:hypothetical protein [Rhizomicrobium sp.]